MAQLSECFYFLPRVEPKAKGVTMERRGCLGPHEVNELLCANLRLGTLVNFDTRQGVNLSACTTPNVKYWFLNSDYKILSVEVQHF